MRDPYDAAYDELVDAVNNFEITDREFRREVAALRDEQRWHAEEAAAEAYDRAMGGW